MYYHTNKYQSRSYSLYNGYMVKSCHLAIIHSKIKTNIMPSDIYILYFQVLYTLHLYVYRSLKAWTTEFDEYIFKYTWLYYIIMLSTASDLAWPDEKGTRFWQYLWVQRKTFIKWYYYISYIYSPYLGILYVY